MVCDTKWLEQESLAELERAVEKLEEGLSSGEVTVQLSPEGAVAFQGWDGSKVGIADSCVFRRLQAAGSMALQQAIARAEVLSGTAFDQGAVEAGVHSHDGGITWGRH